MGSLALPQSGAAYVDSNCVIYSVEKVEPYCTLLTPLWEAAASGSIEIVGSELVVLETLVKPLQENDEVLVATLRALLLESREVRLIPITLAVVERAALLRAQTGMKTPDAIHAATALEMASALFVTNDAAFRRVDGLNVAVLSELVDT